MKEPYMKGETAPSWPESCAGNREGELLGQEQGRFMVLNRCFWGRKAQFKESSGKNTEIGDMDGG
jgi:hypothetical protein